MPAEKADRLRSSRLYGGVGRTVARMLRKHGADPQVESVPVMAAPAALPGRTQPSDPELQSAVQSIRRLSWYHTIDLGNGLVTPGMTDHRPFVDLYQLPESLDGLRCLDVGSLDGFWAFEMERRGAAEVVATDVAAWDQWDMRAESGGLMPTDQTMGDCFQLAHRLLRSIVRRETCSVYELSAERFGKFDLVLISDVLAHLRDPELALERVFGVTRGEVLIAEVYSPALEVFGDARLLEFKGGPAPSAWWVPNTNALKEMIVAAGFDAAQELARFVWPARGVNSDGVAVVNRAAKVILRAKAGQPGTGDQAPRTAGTSQEMAPALSHAGSSR